MKNLWQVLMGSVIALASIGLLLGGFSLSLAEGGMNKPPAVQTATLPVLPTLPGQSSTPPSESPTALPPTPTLTPPPPPTNCPPPPGWVQYQVQAGDTLASLAARYRVGSGDLQQANCLVTAGGLLPGVIIYVPRVATQTAVPCGAPPAWVSYLVRPGDTLFHLSQSYRIPVTELQQANCLGSSTLLHTGQNLYVPPRPPLPPTPTPTDSLTLASTSSTWTNTPTSPTLPVLDTPTDTETETPTDTPTQAPSETPTETPADTATSSPTSSG